MRASAKPTMNCGSQTLHGKVRRGRGATAVWNRWFGACCLIAMSTAVMSVPVLAEGKFVDSRVEGFFRYCYYSDGGALTTDPGSQCPFSNRGLGGQVDIQNTYPAGKLAGEEIRGQWKYCHYYGGASLPIAPTDTCPPTNN